MRRVALLLLLLLCFAAAGCIPTEEAIVEDVPPPLPTYTPTPTPVPPTPSAPVTVLGRWTGDELAAFEAAVKPFTAETGIEMQFETTSELLAVLTTRAEAGNPPDIAILPNSVLLYEFAEKGLLVDLSTFMDIEQLHSDYAQSWLDLASYEGSLYGIFYNVGIKSLVWYSPAAFEAGGYEVPTTWDQLIALSEQIVANGGVPWCIGIESGAASGWPATDWIEDIMLRTAGPEVYDQWGNHEIPWTDPAVKEAWELFGQIARNEDYVYGGTASVPTINFADSPSPMFNDPPGCYMHHQGSFAPHFFPEGLVGIWDYDFFPFPAIDPTYGPPMVGWASSAVMFNDTAEARALMTYLASSEGQEAVVREARLLSPNRRVSLDVYPDDITRALATLVIEAEVFRVDASDMMPPAVGSGSFWEGAMKYVGGTDLDAVLEEIEASAVDAYGE